ncbi:HNH endonuclease [Pseudomonas lini]
MTECALNGIFEECEGITNTREHLIPNALGGRKEVRCICNSCNKKSGGEWDAELIKQLNFLAVLFCSTRERGESQPEVAENNGSQLILFTSDGKIKNKTPSYSMQQLDGSNVRLTVQSNSTKEARRMLKGLLKKENLMASSVDGTFEEEYVSEKTNVNFHFDVSGPKAGRSLIKSVYLFGIHLGLQKSALERAWKYLSVNPSPQCFGPYYDKDIFLSRPRDVPLHVVAIKGCPKENFLYGYLELFGIVRILVLLSEDYRGGEFQSSHILNPITGTEVDLDIRLDLNRSEVETALTPTIAAMKKFEETISLYMPVYMERWKRKNFENLTQWAKKKALQEIGEITMENYNIYIDRVCELIKAATGK